MALNTYRFRLRTPGVTEEQLESDVGIPATIAASAGGVIMDVETDDSRAQDLFEAMESRGFEFVIGGPTTSATAQFLLENGIVGQGAHKALRQLIHFVATNSPGDGFGAGPYVSEVSYDGNVPDGEIWYTDATKTEKICEWAATVNPNQTYATETWIVYQDDGSSPAAEATDVISYTGPRETGRSRTLTVY
jgi:hypothetical protein